MKCFFLFGFLFGFAGLYIKRAGLVWLVGLDWVFLEEELKEVQKSKNLIQDLIINKAFGDLSGIDNIKF